MENNMWIEEYLSTRRCMWFNGPIVVGAVPSDLPTAACLRDQGVPFGVVERSDSINSIWERRTYDRLKLLLPELYLPKNLPDHYPEYPTKRQFIDYLESCANRNEVKPEFNKSVESARFDETSGLRQVRTSSTTVAGKEMEYTCRRLVGSTGENTERVDELNTEFNGEAIHACEYKSGKKFKGKRVLVVGCGNSGMEVSLDLANHNAISSKETEAKASAQDALLLVNQKQPKEYGTEENEENRVVFTAAITTRNRFSILESTKQIV